MSRYFESDGEEWFPNQNAFYEANGRRALKGKRGRKALGQLRDALEALPEKRLIRSALCTVDPDGGRAKRAFVDEDVFAQGEGVCAIGAYLWWKKVKGGMDPQEAFAALPTLEPPDYTLQDTAELAAREAGMALSLAWDLAYRNDEVFDRMTPEQRYGAFMDWINAELAA